LDIILDYGGNPNLDIDPEILKWDFAIAILAVVKKGSSSQVGYNYAD